MAKDKGTKGKDSKKEEKRPYDLFRDSFIRVFGYGGYIGSALRPFVPYSAVNIARALATTYICTDVIDKASKEAASKKNDDKKVTIAGADALCWQMLASVIIPGIILSGVNSLRCSLMCRKSYAAKRIVHTVVNLGTIALIIKPIDIAVDAAMDSTFREWVKEEEPSKDKKQNKGKKK